MDLDDEEEPDSIDSMLEFLYTQGVFPSPGMQRFGLTAAELSRAPDLTMLFFAKMYRLSLLYQIQVLRIASAKRFMDILFKFLFNQRRDLREDFTEAVRFIFTETHDTESGLSVAIPEMCASFFESVYVKLNLGPFAETELPEFGIAILHSLAKQRTGSRPGGGADAAWERREEDRISGLCTTQSLSMLT